MIKKQLTLDMKQIIYISEKDNKPLAIARTVFSDGYEMCLLFLVRIYNDDLKNVIWMDVPVAGISKESEADEYVRKNEDALRNNCQTRVEPLVDSIVVYALVYSNPLTDQEKLIGLYLTRESALARIEEIKDDAVDGIYPGDRIALQTWRAVK